MSFKTKIDIAGQKIKGIAQQVKGEIEVKAGYPVEGAINKVRGKANIVVADIRKKANDTI
jgi:uncharacterized protein YjbJ (UPF0337 family)